MTLLVLLALLFYCIKQRRQALPHRRKTAGVFVALVLLWLVMQVVQALLPLLAAYAH